MNRFLSLIAVAALSTPIAVYAAKPAPAPAPPTLEEQMLSHVEKVLVVDSLTVDKFDFFKAYRLYPSAGRILSGAEVARTLKGVEVPDEFSGDPFTGFTNEFNDFLVWAQEDTTGVVNIAESVRLIDGSWSRPEFTLEFPDAAFPFMLDDGQTLYFAADNESSLGGYDIFVATKDPSDGSYLIPGNVGMPFNSEYDDYMMAVDRQSGLGWWATDRNQLGDRITIYIYALSDDRVNVDPEDENLEAYATLSGWRELLDERQLAEAERLKAQLAAIKAPESRRYDFTLPMPGGRTYHFYSDFKNGKAAAKMQLYMSQKSSLRKKEKDLGALRGQYASGNTSLASRILTLEEQVRNDSKALDSLLSEIYQLEN